MQFKFGQLLYDVICATDPEGRSDASDAVKATLYDLKILC